MKEFIIDWAGALDPILALCVVIALSSASRHKKLFLFLAGGALCLALTLQGVHCLRQ